VTLAGYEAKVKELEGGRPLPALTLAESTTQIEALIRGEDWQTAGEREAAQKLIVRLARFRWSLEPQPGAAVRGE
jgi:hypothetical protein